MADYFNDMHLRATRLTAEENDKGHGRIKQRLAYACDEIAWLQKVYEWPALKSMCIIIATVESKGKKTQEQRFYISSLPADARQLNQAARLHWGIESAPQAHKVMMKGIIMKCK